MEDLDRLLRGLSIYQDVVLDGVTVRRGVRDCETRWRAIAPHLPESGTLLDVGANFGWFCLRWCAEGENRVAAALEADLRSAAVQRYALASHAHRRIALLTAKACTSTIERFAAAEQRFDAVLCLSVLHWIPDHRSMLAALGRIADRIFVEHCDPREAGAGVASIRRAIGDIGPYLTALFPERRVERLAQWTAHRSDEFPRELWLVSRPQSPPAVASSRPAGLDADALLDLEVAWPPRSWWLRECEKAVTPESFRATFQPNGLLFQPSSAHKPSISHRRRISRARKVPERAAFAHWLRFRRAVKAALRRLKVVFGSSL